MWPRSSLGPDEREGETDENYVVIFTDENGELHRWETTLAMFESFEMGQGVVLSFDSFGNLDEVSAP